MKNKKINSKKINTDFLKKAKIRSILRFLLPVFTTLVSVGISYLFWIFVFKGPLSKVGEYPNQFKTYTIVVSVIALLITIFIGIITPKMYRKSSTTNVALLLNVVIFVTLSVISHFVIFSCLYYFKNFINVNINTFWTVYMYPITTYAATTIAYVLLTIKNPGPVYWKAKLAIGIGTVCSFIPAAVLFGIYIKDHPMSDCDSIMRLFAMISPLLAMAFMFATNKHMLYKLDNIKCVFIDSFWLSNMVGGCLTSIFSIIINWIGILLMAGGAGGGGGGGGSGGSKSNSYYDKEDFSGKKYHTNADGTLTDEYGGKHVPVDGGYVKA